jgi:DNA processing protein
VNERLGWLRLATLRGLRRGEARWLLRRYGAPQRACGRSRQELAAGLEAARAAELAAPPDLAGLRALAAELERDGIELLPAQDARFPELLRQIPDPPLWVFLRGRLEPARPCVAIVGSRRPTARGREAAHAFAAHLARHGVSVVSGLAYGIDAASHLGALEGRGHTVAVLASGLDQPTPRGQRELALRILAAGGAWLSEHPPGTTPLPGLFPERNRLISGLARATLVVEARERSGTLWTARHALDQGRDVLVVPGPIDTDACRGSNAWLREGATPILDADDLLRTVAPELALAPRAPPTSAHPVLRALREGPLDPDSLAEIVGLEPGALARELLQLELDGEIVREGARVALAILQRP